MKKISILYKALISFAVFSFFAMIEIVIIEKNMNFEILFIGILINFLILAPLNTAFLLTLYYLNIFRNCLDNFFWMLIEIVLFFLLGSLFSHIISTLPTQILFNITKSRIERRFFFNDWLIIFYEYFLLFLFFYVLKGIFKRRKTKQNLNRSQK